jgi:beta-lactamase regulating signal transducer with metallopeptidase domain
MNSILLYVIKTGIILATFYIVYQIFFRKDTFFRLRRNLLLIGLCISILLPVIPYSSPFPNHLNGINIESTVKAIPDINYITAQTADISNPSSIRDFDGNSPQIPIGKILLYIYFLGVIMTGSRLLFQVIKTQLLVNISDCSIRQGIRIVRLKEDYLPFTMFKTIFYNPAKIKEEDFKKIFIHEKAHIEQGHYFDLLLTELILIIQWFNPFMWLYASAIKENHEFLADNAVISQHSDKPAYQILLVNQAIGITTACLANNFYSSLKNRILMITKTRTPRLAQLKVLIMLPIFGILLLAFSQPSEYPASPRIQEFNGQKYYEIKGKVMDKETHKPISGAVVLISGTSNGCVTSEKGEFTVEVPDLNSELVFSYINHLEVLIAVKNQKSLTVYLDSGLKSNAKMEIPYRSQGIGRIVWKNDTTFTVKPTPPPADLSIVAKGIVVDKDNKHGISGAKISVIGKNSEVLSNFEGRFKIEVPDFDFKLLVVAKGQSIELDNSDQKAYKSFTWSDKTATFELKTIEL